VLAQAQIPERELPGTMKMVEHSLLKFATAPAAAVAVASADAPVGPCCLGRRSTIVLMMKLMLLLLLPRWNTWSNVLPCQSSAKSRLVMMRDDCCQLSKERS
jgi:hypothetical protein